MCKLNKLPTHSMGGKAIELIAFLLISIVLNSVKAGTGFWDTRDRTAWTCRWVGTAPFCQAGCEAGEEQESKDSNGGGATCWSGAKYHCCAPLQRSKTDVLVTIEKESENKRLKDSPAVSTSTLSPTTRASTKVWTLAYIAGNPFNSAWSPLFATNGELKSGQGVSSQGSGSTFQQSSTNSSTQSGLFGQAFPSFGLGGSGMSSPFSVPKAQSGNVFQDMFKAMDGPVNRLPLAANKSEASPNAQARNGIANSFPVFSSFAQFPDFRGSQREEVDGPAQDKMSSSFSNNPFSFQ